MIELVIFIVIIGVAMAGFVALFATTSRSSADPMVRKQMLAVAESLMEEVVMQPFTFCDPDDPSATTALVPAFSGTAGCSTAAFVQTGPMTGETRTDAVTPFDNVVDYSGLAPITPITDLAGNILIDEEPTNSSVNVTIQTASFNSRDEGRDAHIRSADFLDVENHPTLSFASTGLRRDGDDWVVTGDLTGTWDETTWWTDEHLPVRIERTLDLSGPATFSETSKLQLTSLTPAS